LQSFASSPHLYLFFSRDLALCRTKYADAYELATSVLISLSSVANATPHKLNREKNMKSSLETVNAKTPKEFVEAVKAGYYLTSITVNFPIDEYYNYFNETKNEDMYHAFCYGLLYNNGLGNRIDYKEALLWLSDAAAQGLGYAFCIIGEFYEYGYGIEIDGAAAVEYYQRAYEKGCYFALVMLACCYVCGTGVPKDIKKAEELFLKVINEHEYYHAYSNLAELYRIYYKDYEKAYIASKKGADLGIEECFFSYALLCSNPKFGHTDYSESVKYYQMLADCGNEKAMHNLAFMYSNGKGVEKDPQKEFELFSMAAKGGNANTLNSLAICYLLGKGTEKDIPKAVELFEKSAQGGAVEAYRALYILYSSGKYLPVDLEKASKYRKLAIESGNAEALNAVLLEYIVEIYTKIENKALENKDEAKQEILKMIEKVSAFNEFTSNYVLAELYNILFLLAPAEYPESYQKSLDYAKSTYENGKELASSPCITNTYGSDFFEANTDCDFISLDEKRLESAYNAVAGVQMCSNNYSNIIWLLRARLIFAFYYEQNYDEQKRYYNRAVSINGFSFSDGLDKVLYSNALYVYAIRNRIGGLFDVNEKRAINSLKLGADRYHFACAYLYANYCKEKGDYENAYKYYSIAASDKYPSKARKVQSGSALFGSSSSYTVYDYSVGKTQSKEAICELVIDFEKYQVFAQSNKEEYFRGFLALCDDIIDADSAFASFARFAPHLVDEFLEKFAYSLNSVSSLDLAIKALKADKAQIIADNILQSGSLDDIRELKRIASTSFIYSAVQDKIEAMLYELGDEDTVAKALINEITDFDSITSRLIELAKDKNEIALNFFNESYEKSNTVYKLGIELGAPKCLEVYANELLCSGEYQRAKEINPSLATHPIWSYLLFGKCAQPKDESGIREIARILLFPSELSVSERERELGKIVNFKAPPRLGIDTVKQITDFAKKSNMQVQCGYLLLWHNCPQGMLMLIKAYKSTSAYVSIICDLALALGDPARERTDIYTFNKAMYMYESGGFFARGKAKGLLNDLASRKSLPEYLRAGCAPYQPAIDWLNGKDVKCEYLLSVKK